MTGDAYVIKFYEAGDWVCKCYKACKPWHTKLLSRGSFIKLCII